MIGLRKVVKLTIEEIPEERAVFNRKKSGKNHSKVMITDNYKGEDVNYIYTWRNRYYLGKEQVFKSRTHDNIFNLPLIEKIKGKEILGDETLKKLSQNIINGEDDFEKDIFEGEDFLYYTKDDGSKISFPRGDTKKVKQLVFEKDK